jgi:hypothetical protein
MPIQSKLCSHRSAICPQAILTPDGSSYTPLPFEPYYTHPLGQHIKKIVCYVRGFQLFLRIVEFMGAAGALILPILITGLGDSNAYIMRISVSGKHFTLKRGFSDFY